MNNGWGAKHGSLIQTELLDLKDSHAIKMLQYIPFLDHEKLFQKARFRKSIAFTSSKYYLL